MNPHNIELPDLGLFPNFENADFTKLPPLPKMQPILERQESQCEKKDVKKYFRYYELMDTIKDMRKENKRLRYELQKFAKKYLKNT